MSRYVVAQTPESGAWRHYLCGWYGDVPAWDTSRDRALKLDEQAAHQLVDRFDRRAVWHYIEELPS